MPKEVVISTSGLNCYGSRVMTSGIDLTQYQKNPILLWMHRRCYDGESMPIGRIDNLHIDGDRLIGTPVFDEKDEFAKAIASKWEDGFLKMASAGIEIVDTSVDPVNLITGQTRPTVMHSKLVEVSIVDIGGNDDALQLMQDGKLITFAKGSECPVLPLLKLDKEDQSNADVTDTSDKSNNNNNKKMKKETLELLGLPETATEQEIHDKIKLYKEKAEKVETLELANVKTAIDTAIKEHRITEANREQFMAMGKQVGAEALRQTLELIRPAQRPTDVIIPSTDQPAQTDEPKKFAKLSEVPADQIEKLKDEKPSEYAKLYKAEYGIELV